MPRRRHIDKSRFAGPLTVDELQWWDSGAPGLIEECGSQAAARETYKQREPVIRTNPGTRLRAFWVLFAPELPPLPEVMTTSAQSWAAVDRQNRAQARWMLDHPEHLWNDADRAEWQRRLDADPPKFPAGDNDEEIDQ